MAKTARLTYSYIVCGILLLLSQVLSAATCTTGYIGGISGTYYKNINFTGSSATRTDNSIDFDWGTGSTGMTGGSTDTFSIRWTGNIRAPVTGNYQFQTTTDDGVRLWINGNLVIDNWTDHSVTTDTSATISLTAGQSYTVKMEFYENGGYAVAKLYWSVPGAGGFAPITTQTGVTHDTSSFCTVPTTPCTTGFVGGAIGKYYNNMTLTGTPVTRNDGSIEFNWASGSPGVTGIGADNFSVRWDASLKVATTGNYQFETVSDDGVRLYVNNVLVINNWTDHSSTSNTTGNIALTAGVYYPIRMEFYENGGSAVAALHLKYPSSSSFVGILGCPTTMAAYTISHSGTGITCAGEPITFTAVDSGGGAIAPTAGTQITLSTTPATGTWVGGNTYTFTGAESSIIKYLQQTSVGTWNINVTDGLYSESASADPSINFVAAGLKFSTIPTEQAGVADNTVTLSAIRTDNNTGACVAQVTGTKPVQLGYVCRNPATCVAGQTLTLNGTGVQSNPNTALASPAYTTMNLAFNASGTASIPLNYSDVGQLSLAAQMSLPASGNDPAVTMTGASNAFVVKPYALAISGVQNSSSASNPGGTSSANSSARFVSAGTPFKVFVQSRNAQGNPTPNFGNESPSEISNVSIAATSLVYPSGGNLTPLTNTGSFAATTPAGTIVNTGISWKQVGSLVITPSLSDNDYLGGGNIANIVNSGTVGRIYPDHFTLSNLTYTNACAALTTPFTYMGQPLPFGYTIKAEATDGTPLTNFSGDFVTLNNHYGFDATTNTDYRAAVAHIAESNDTGNSTNPLMSPRLAIAAAMPTWSAGVFNLPTTTLQYTRQASGAPDGPLTGVQLGIQLTDNFDGRAIVGADMKGTTSGSCGSSCDAKAVGVPMAIRYGRLRMDDAFGPETFKLPVNFVTEYWVGGTYPTSGYFATNTIDSCTVINRADATYPAGSLAVDTNRTVGLSVGNTTGTYVNLDTTGVHMNAGTAGLYFTAPSAAGTGSFVLGVNMTNLGWLQFDWNKDGNFADATLPNATITFGSYRGNDRLIYWREKLP